MAISPYVSTVVGAHGLMTDPSAAKVPAGYVMPEMGGPIS
jgi:hypothetical protein